MLCQTIELTKTWKNVRLHIVHPELPKIRKRLLKHLEKLYFGFLRKKQLILIIFANNYEIWVLDGQYVGGHLSKSFVSSIVWQSINHFIYSILSLIYNYRS